MTDGNSMEAYRKQDYTALPPKVATSPESIRSMQINDDYAEYEVKQTVENLHV